MNPKNPSHPRQAKRIVEARFDGSGASADEKSRLIYDLSLHQIELEMQNEELRRMQEELELARDRYADLYDFAPVGYLTIDDDGLVLEANLMMARQLNLERSKLVGAPLSHFVLPADQLRFIQMRNRLSTSDASQETELRLLDGSGGSLRAHINSLLVVDGGTRRYRLAVSDISQLKRAEENQAWLASFAELSPSPIVEMDLAGGVQYLNPAALELLPDLQRLGRAHPWLAGLDPYFSEFRAGGATTALRDVSLGDLAFQQTISYVASSQRVRIYAVDITARKNAQEAARQARAELEKLVVELKAANEQLRLEGVRRQKLAQNLHDAINQSLFSAGLIADVLPRLWVRDPDRAQQSLEGLRRLTRGAQAEMRLLLAELRPSVLAQTELGELLNRQATSLAGRINVPIDVKVSGAGLLPAEVQETFYRLTQEALTNVVKHAEAGHIEVRYWNDERSVDLSILDDGCGFDPAQLPQSGHYGLAMMRERAEAIGVRLKIISQPGKGTEISAFWPKPEAAGREDS